PRTRSFRSPRSAGQGTRPPTCAQDGRLHSEGDRLSPIAWACGARPQLPLAAAEGERRLRQETLCKIASRAMISRYAWPPLQIGRRVLSCLLVTDQAMEAPSSMRSTSWFRLGALITIVQLVAACSGGGAGSGASTIASTAPVITTQPTSQTVTAGQAATFTVAASGTVPLTYQWKMNGDLIASATASSYSTGPATVSDNGVTFTVAVSNSSGVATSKPATLTLNAAAVAPSIATQPINVTVTVGQPATFTVAATGTEPLLYQWYRNGTAMAAATATSYTI